ncbi:MFS transporter [Streptomyces sp. NPDC059070]|uniref:MFS transporter n=1 Tax=Streptomyces sp. NPDC059070 TaxID=3346713 RepID=UPI003676A20E
MYLSTIDRPRGAPRPGRRDALTAVGANVLVLGAVSLLTDVSSEMVTAVLPLYLVLTLHLGPAAYGVLDGLYTGATALLRLVGGYTADRFRTRKAVAAVGYGMSALAKLGLLAAGAPTAIGAVIVADRAGKGLRTAPRDALIALSVPEPLLGRAFGTHRAMDSAGAFAGPLVALGVLAVAGTTAAAFDALFFTSFCIACAALLTLAVFARDHHDERPAAPAPAPRAALGLLRGSGTRRLLCAATALGLSTVGDGFVYLVLLRRQGFSTGWFPWLAVGTSLVYLLLATPFGALADRYGRAVLLRWGYLALAGVYLLLASPFPGTPVTLACLCLYGAFYACTDGVLMALAAPAFPPALRTTGLACVQTAQALAYFASSVGFGLAWAAWGPATASGAAVVAVAGALAVTVPALKDRTVEETSA